MKIIKRGNRKSTKLQGECNTCGCVVECTAEETKTIVDRDTQPGMATQYVKCPECKAQYLWVK